MKSIDKITMMTPEQLGNIAEDTSIQVPEDIRQDISDVLEARSVCADLTGHTRRFPYAAVGAVGAAAASAAIVLSLNAQPKDTFDDPAMAYAQLQETFNYINSKSTKALGIASESMQKLDKATGMMNTINF